MRSWLKTKREAKGLSQSAVAQKLGLSRQAYNFIENGQRQVSLNLSTAEKISKIFKISLNKISEYEKQG